MRASGRGQQRLHEETGAPSEPQTSFFWTTPAALISPGPLRCNTPVTHHHRTTGEKPLCSARSRKLAASLCCARSRRGPRSYYSAAYPPPPHDSHTSPQVRTRRRSPLEEISTEICAKLVSSAETAAAPQSVDSPPTKASSATRHAVIAFSHRHFEPQAACTTAIKEDAIAAARFSRHPARPCIRPALG